LIGFFINAFCFGEVKVTNWPTLADYQSAINTPSCFLDSDLQQAKVSSSLIQGTNTFVYQMQHNNKSWAVRFFLKEIIDQENRYTTLSKYLKSIWIPNLVNFSYLAQGIQINGKSFPIVKMDWVQGVKLNDYITKNLNNPKFLMILAAQWRGLVNTLRGNRLSHGDLEPNNILINEQEQILLVDYDSIFNPSLRGQNSLELGNSDFQHPQRNLQSFDEKSANFSSLVIYLSLRALAVDQNLWQKYHKSTNLIFSMPDFQNPRGSQLFTELKSSFDPSVAALAKQLEIACLMPFDATPDFESIVNQSLSTTSTDIEIPPTRVTGGLKKPTTSPMDENIRNSVANQISSSNFEHQATSTNQARSTNPIADKDIPLTRVDISGELSPTKVGKRGSDLNFNAQISLEDAAKGITLSIKIPRLQFCQSCQGKMMMDDSSKCRTCKGQGKVNIENTFNINIQPGVKDGERLCLTGQGEVSFDGGANGDLYVNIVIRQHHFFQRQGNDLYCTVNITPEQLGQEIAFLTIDGKNIMVNIPTNTTNGTLIPVAGKGMPIIGESKNGDLYLTANLISNKVNNSQPPNYSSNTNQPFNNPYAPYVSPLQQAQQNQRPLYYPDPLNDPSNSPNRTPFDNSYNPSQNMELQKIPPYQQPYQMPNQIPMGAEAFLDSIMQQIKTNAMIAFALSVLSLFCFGAIAGPVSFILGGKALKLIKQHNIGYDYRVWALAGRYIGIFSFVLNILIFLAVVFS
jgi:DnaJ-class molecular chaperone